MKKHTYYMPLTAAPFKRSEKYRELLPQKAELTGYIRCFWGSGQPYVQTGETADSTLVIPDTCVDIIYYIDDTANTVTGGFFGINDTSFWHYDNADDGHRVSVFAIRFFAWGVYCFSEDSMKDTRNGFEDVQARFRWLDNALRQQLFEKRSLEERCAVAEALLLARLSHTRQNDMISAAARRIIFHRGAQSISELTRECFVSSRHLERLFHEYIGITPKKLSSIVRFQFLWNEILQNPIFQVLDAVSKYGYTDQSHLLREFKRYHTMDIQAARLHACRQACNNVENIQDISDK